MTQKQLEKKYNPLIGCTTYIDNKTGELIIDSKSKIIKMNDSWAIGKFVGLSFLSDKYVVCVGYGGGFQIAGYQDKFVKII